jgi:hypothetical protein
MEKIDMGRVTEPVDFNELRKAYFEARRMTTERGGTWPNNGVLRVHGEDITLDLDRLWDKYGAREDRPEAPIGCMTGGRAVPNWDVDAPGHLSLVPEVEDIGRYFDEGGTGKLTIYASKSLGRSFVESAVKKQNHIANLAGGNVTVVYRD